MCTWLAGHFVYDYDVPHPKRQPTRPSVKEDKHVRFIFSIYAKAQCKKFTNRKISKLFIIIIVNRLFIVTHIWLFIVISLPVPERCLGLIIRRTTGYWPFWNCGLWLHRRNFKPELNNCVPFPKHFFIKSRYSFYRICFHVTRYFFVVRYLPALIVMADERRHTRKLQLAQSWTCYWSW